MTRLDLTALVSDWPVGDACIAVLDASGVIAAHDSGARHPWASVTKILTALAVLDAWADGTVGLDDPAGPPGSTVRHLLAHAAGLAFDEPRTVAVPGTRRSYSNTGYDLVAEHVGAAAGGSFADEVQGRVLDRLGLTGTRIAGSPAKDGIGPLADLIAIAAELLSPRVLGPEIVTLASTLAFPGLAGVLPGFGRQVDNDWGLGCEIRAHKLPHWTSPQNSPRTFGHFGQAGSFLWVDPDAGLACVSICDTPFGPWAAQRWPELSTAVLRAAG